MVQVTYYFEDSPVDVDFVLNASEILLAVQYAIFPTMSQSSTTCTKPDPSMNAK
jgi:hypothetical protein